MSAPKKSSKRRATPTPDDPDDTYVVREEAAAFLGISEPTLRRREKDGSLPVVVAVLIYLTSPDYISLLFTTTTGHLTLAASGFWMMIGILVMRKMINFDF